MTAQWQHIQRQRHLPFHLSIENSRVPGTTQLFISIKPCTMAQEVSLAQE
jgi:hypothetical protein